METDNTRTNGYKAYELAVQGWHVFPCKPDKSPLTDPALGLVHGLLQATNDTAQVVAWWTQHPEALVGVVPGNTGHTAIDLDRHEGRPDGFNTAEAQELPTAADTSGVSLSGNGTHLWFAGSSQSVNHIYPGIDRKSVGGYVVVNYDLPRPEEITEELPAVYAIQGAGVSGSDYDGDLSDWINSHKGIADSVHQVLANLPDPFRGHGEMLRVQTALVKLGSEGVTGVTEGLLEARKMWLSVPHGNDAAGSAEAEWDRAMAEAIRKYGAHTEMPLFEGLIGSTVEDDGLPIHDFALKRGLVTLTRHDLDSLPDPEWWVDNLWQQGTVGVLAGEGAIGKTFLMLDMVACMGLGVPWHDLPTTKARTVYVAAEGVRSYHKRIKAWEDFYEMDFPDDQVLFVQDGYKLTGDPADSQKLKDVADYFKADFIVLDTFSALSSLDSENDATAVAAVIRSAQSLAKGSNRTVVLVHHANKSDGKIRGSSVIRDNTDTMVAARYPMGRDEDSGARRPDKDKDWYISTHPSDDGKQKDGEPVKIEGFRLVSVLDSAVITKDHYDEFGGLKNASQGEDGPTIGLG